MRILICGGRNYAKQAYLNSVLDELDKALSIKVVIHGNARGADRLGAHWACQNRIKIYYFNAQWGRYGRSAGPIRNQQMLDEGRPDLVVAFPGRVGTRDMIRKAKRVGVMVITP